MEQEVTIGNEFTTPLRREISLSPLGVTRPKESQERIGKATLH